MVRKRKKRRISRTALENILKKEIEWRPARTFLMTIDGFGTVEILEHIGRTEYNDVQIEARTWTLTDITVGLAVEYIEDILENEGYDYISYMFNEITPEMIATASKEGVMIGTCGVYITLYGKNNEWLDMLLAVESI